MINKETPSVSYASMERAFPFKRYHKQGAALPELRFGTQDVHDNVDPIECRPPSGNADVGLEVVDDLFSMYIDLEKLEEQEGIAGYKDDAFVNGGGFVVEKGDDGGGRRPRREEEKNVKNETRKRPRRDDQKTCLDDGGLSEPRKAILEEELAQLWAVNPKRARRIMANRQSAARSKEKKARYTLELERKVKTLHAKTMALTSQLAINQKDITDLVAEKSELKLQLQTTERQAKLYDAQNEELQLDIEKLKTAIGETDYSGWHNKRMNHMPHSLSNSSLELPQLPTSPMSQKKLPPLLHSSQISTSPQYLHIPSSQPTTKVLQKEPTGDLTAE